MPGNGYRQRVARLEARVCCLQQHVRLLCVRCDFTTWDALTGEERVRLHGYLRRRSTGQFPVMGVHGPCPRPGCGVRLLCPSCDPEGTGMVEGLQAVLTLPEREDMCPLLRRMAAHA